MCVYCVSLTFPSVCISVHPTLRWKATLCNPTSFTRHFTSTLNFKSSRLINMNPLKKQLWFMKACTSLYLRPVATCKRSACMHLDIFVKMPMLFLLPCNYYTILIYPSTISKMRVLFHIISRAKTIATARRHACWHDLNSEIIELLTVNSSYFYPLSD